jgi:predicted metal-dependent RNase
VDRFRFSGHSNRRELLSLVEELNPKKIVLVHGEKKAKEWMADNIRFFFPDIEIHVPAEGETLTL